MQEEMQRRDKIKKYKILNMQFIKKFSCPYCGIDLPILGNFNYECFNCKGIFIIKFNLKKAFFNLQFLIFIFFIIILFININFFVEIWHVLSYPLKVAFFVIFFMFFYFLFVTWIPKACNLIPIEKKNLINKIRSGIIPSIFLIIIFIIITFFLFFLVKIPLHKFIPIVISTIIVPIFAFIYSYTILKRLEKK